MTVRVNESENEQIRAWSDSQGFFFLSLLIYQNMIYISWEKMLKG